MNLTEVLTKIPCDGDHTNRIRGVLRRSYFVKDNKWLKDSNLIMRYKKVPPLNDTLGGGYQKTIANMIRCVISHLISSNRIDGRLVTMSKMRGTYNYRILFDRGNRDIGMLRGVLQANPAWYTWNEWSITRITGNEFVIKYSSLGSLTGTTRANNVVTQAKSIEQFKNEVGPIFAVLAGLFPAPEGAPTMVADDGVPEIEV